MYKEKHPDQNGGVFEKRAKITFQLLAVLGMILLPIVDEFFRHER